MTGEPLMPCGMTAGAFVALVALAIDEWASSVRAEEREPERYIYGGERVTEAELLVRLEMARGSIPLGPPEVAR